MDTSMWAELLPSILFYSGAAALGFIARGYTSTYISKKGENLATKEDIGAITKIVEEAKSAYENERELLRANIGIQAALSSEFKSRTLDAIVSIDDILVAYMLYCWGKVAELSPNEHYVWGDERGQNIGTFASQFQVAVDRSALKYGLYLTSGAKGALSDLAKQIAGIAGMERAIESAGSDLMSDKQKNDAYFDALNSVEQCREKIMIELGLPHQKNE